MTTTRLTTLALTATALFLLVGRLGVPRPRAGRDDRGDEVTTISPALVATLALRDDYPDGSCWAWVDSSGRRCAKPGERLCARHLQVAEARLAKLAKLAAEVAGLRAGLAS